MMSQHNRLGDVVRFALDRLETRYNVNITPLIRIENSLGSGRISYPRDYFHVLFDHKFAQFVFGEPTKWAWYVDGECIDIVGGEEMLVPESFPVSQDGQPLYQESYVEVNGWKYHLQQAVVSADPLDYYWQYITKLSDKGSIEVSSPGCRKNHSIRAKSDKG